MPIYEFVCAECDHEFESLQRLSDPLPTECPECGKGPVTKKISAAGFRLKGGGWYETDFKNGSKSGAAPTKPAADGASSGTPAAGSSTAATAGTGGDSAGSSSGKDAAAPSTSSSSKPSKPSGGSSE